MEDSPTTADWSGTVYGPTTPRPRKRAPAGAPVATSSKRAATAAKRAPRKAATPAKPPARVLDDEELLAHLDVVLADASTPPSAPAAPATRTAAPADEQAAPAHGSARPSARTPLWTLLVADPAFAAEHLASETVLRLGPQAREWVDRTRERYPVARPDALAQLAAEEHVRIARRNSLTSTTALGTVAELGLLARIHASLVLTVAAVYGEDPTATERVRDLLDLLPIPRLTQPSLATVSTAGRLLGAVAVRRLGARLIPFGAAVAGAIHSGRATQDLAMHAIARFRP